MKTEIVSFYSDIDNRTYYSDHAKRLRQNCIELNIKTKIYFGNDGRKEKTICLDGC